MRIVADLELCQGHAMCELEAPEVFSVPKRGKVSILAERPAPGQLGEVRRAVQECPTQALRLAEENADED
ncbi:MAG TPA: ferredoxin [Pseudonocardiaceae bacterium]|jgi:ferredoxin|nr:ferredoxin [Pseudonocardiaceae bacterium]